MRAIDPRFATMNQEELRDMVARIERWIPILWTAGETETVIEYHDLAQRLTLRAVELEHGEAA